tara:strand:+ start:460 stop:879 length:420 start_codon:yes stop_codon:yes gene_type:complete
MKHKIIGKYIKNVDFNIPNPKTFFLLEKDIKNYKINIDIKSNQIKENIIEVETCLFLKPINNELEKIKANILFATIIEIEESTKDKKLLEEIILVKVPNEIYPEVRNLFILLFEKSGFKQIKIEENINFKDLFNKKTIQ